MIKIDNALSIGSPAFAAHSFSHAKCKSRFRGNACTSVFFRSVSVVHASVELQKNYETARK